MINGQPLTSEAYFFACFDQNITNNKCQMKSMMHTVLDHAHDNILVLKYFFTTTNFSSTYVSPDMFNFFQ